MLFQRFSVLFLAGLSCFSGVVVVAQDPAMDMQVGMEGLMRAAKDPAMMAQLMQDMQDPELMAEAKKMMDDPEFQKQMGKLAQNPEFKNSIKQTQQAMQDPHHAAKMEAKVEHMMKVGQESLKKGAKNSMEDALAAMNNPEALEEMARMLKDPSFKKELEAMYKDPQFQNYVAAMQDMMKDPAQKRKVEEIQQNIKASM